VTTYFVTGATGVVGSAIAEQLLRDTDAQVRLLVRAQSDAELQGRAQQLHRFWGIEPPEVGKRLEAIRGDTTLPGLGVAPDAYERLVHECTHIVHCAAAVRMNLPLEEARRTAVTGAQNLIELSRACQRNGVLQKVEFVSTVGVAGRRFGSLPERWIHEQRDFHNTYEQSKAEAEAVVETEIQSGLPATVHRPSMVVGDSRTGKIIHFQIFYHLAEFLSGRRTRGLFPALGDHTIDLVPVDFVARAILWSSRRTDMVGKVLHLCAGPHGALPLRTLRERVRSRFERAGIHIPRALTIPARVFQAAIRIVSAFANERERRALATLPIFLDYLAEEQQFENVETTQTLRAAGIHRPEADEMLDPVLGYYLAQRAAAK
jgi:thioester reductase-like protein